MSTSSRYEAVVSTGRAPSSPAEPLAAMPSACRHDSHRLRLAGRTFFLHGRSQLAGMVEDHDGQMAGRSLGEGENVSEGSRRRPEGSGSGAAGGAVGR